MRNEKRYDTNDAHLSLSHIITLYSNSIVYIKQDDAFPTELDDDDHTLAYYGICDGTEILMNEVDIEAKQREEARIVKEHEERVAKQEREARALQELKKSDAKARSVAIEKAAQRPAA